MVSKERLAAYVTEKEFLSDEWDEIREQLKARFPNDYFIVDFCGAPEGSDVYVLMCMEDPIDTFAKMKKFREEAAAEKTRKRREASRESRRAEYELLKKEFEGKE